MKSEAEIRAEIERLRHKAIRPYPYHEIRTQAALEWVLSGSEATLTADAPEIAAAETRGRLEGLKEAATIAGTMAERPYDNEPEFGAVLAVEAAIVARIEAHRAPVAA